MSNSTRFRAFSNTLFSKTAWIATVALVASLLVVVPVGGQAAKAAASVLPTSISVGDYHACGVVEGGVQCWGYNEQGQLGVVGAHVKSSSVQAIPSGVGATQVSAGELHSCAVVAGGVQCWGFNASGQVGDATQTDRALPVTVLASNSGATQVSAGERHTCAVVAGGVHCWGRNNYGQLGNNSSTNSSIPVVAIAVGAGATQVSAGKNHTCAVVAGVVHCWGLNDTGQLGNASTTNSPVPVAIAAGAGVTQVSAGGSHTCAVATGGVKCWGNNSTGQLGDASNTQRLSPVTAITVNSVVTQVSAANGFTCATVSGAVSCWGLNNQGQLGNSTLANTSTPTPSTGLSAGALLVDGGGSSACAVLEASIQCWGSNSHGQLGNETILYATTPQASLNFASLTDLGSGGYFTCALAAGAVKCWGTNTYGQLGNGTTTSSSLPVTAIESGATALSVGFEHACAIVAGAVKCWGRNAEGQLGDGSLINRLTPVTVSGITSTASAIAAGGTHTCAVANTLVCWGDNYWGQLGNGSTTSSPTPVVVSGITGPVTQIALGWDHSCSIDNGLVKCWGANHLGQLGNGTGGTQGDKSTTPVSVSGLITVTSISAGSANTCVVDGGAVKCWGNNAAGQVGDDSTTERLSPVAVLGLASGVSSVELGESYSCARGNTGGVQCWGFNNAGQLGIGTSISTKIATPVSGLSADVDLVAPGYRHTCAAVGTSVKCWGENFDGALGLTRTAFSATPIAATGVFRAAVVTPNVNAGGGGQQAVAVDPATLLKPELAKAKRTMVSIKGQRVTLTGTNLKNVDSILVGAKATTILSSSESELVIDVPANLAGLPQVTLVSKSGIQTVAGVMQIVKPYLARSVKVSSFQGNGLTKSAALAIRKSYLRDSSVNTVSCAAVIGKGTSARVKAATIAKSVSACSAVSGYSVKFSEFKIAVRTLKTPLKTPYVTVTLSRSTPSLVN